MNKVIFLVTSLLWNFSVGAVPRIVYSQETMHEHKMLCIKNIQASQVNLKDPSYQMARAVKTIWGDDSDYIPKVVGAGEISDDGKNRYQLMHNGVKIILHSYYETQWLTDVIYALKGHHEPQEEKCFYEVLKYMPEGATMIELGAYWGYYSLWFSSEVKNAKNYLIEPDFYHLEAGRKNFVLNDKTAVFTQGWLGKSCPPGVPCISVNEFIDQHGISHINILHADIQGSECEMLETVANHLHKIDYFFISTHNTEAQCLAFFRKHGLVIVAEHTGNESCSGDGLIVAKRRGANGPDHIDIRKY